jgi:hypothetical protein
VESRQGNAFAMNEPQHMWAKLAWELQHLTEAMSAWKDNAAFPGTDITCVQYCSNGMAHLRLALAVEPRDPRSIKEALQNIVQGDQERHQQGSEAVSGRRGQGMQSTSHLP